MHAVIRLFMLAALSVTGTLLAEPVSQDMYYTPPQSHLVYVDTTSGNVVIALNDAIAPHHVARFQELVKSGFYNNKHFYRVIEGFVAQGGANEEVTGSPLTAPLDAEFSAKNVEGFYEIQRPAAYAPVSGFIYGFAAGTTPSRDAYWLAHCPGTLAMARDNGKDTGSTEFYIVIGQAPRHLDRNMSVFGRVVAGMDVLQRLPRGDVANGGVIGTPTEDSKINAMKLGTQLPAAAQRHFSIQRGGHPDYQKKIQAARELANPFFADKSLAPRPIDVCYYQTGVEEVTEQPH